MQRKHYDASLKARVVLKALSGESTTSELAKQFGVHPMMITKWKKQVVQQLPQFFSAKPDQERGQWAQREAELFQQIGQLQYELQWLKKKTAAYH